jgi:hypothetical protein
MRGKPLFRRSRKVDNNHSNRSIMVQKWIDPHGKFVPAVAYIYLSTAISQFALLRKIDEKQSGFAWHFNLGDQSYHFSYCILDFIS